MDISTADALRALYPEPRERALRKQLAAIDVHARRYIELSPFVVLASCGAAARIHSSHRSSSGSHRLISHPAASTARLPVGTAT